jgi:hypothetical protein
MKSAWTWGAAALAATLGTIAASGADAPAWGSGEGALFAAENHRAALGLDVPGANGWHGRTVGTGRPGALFFPGESVDLDVQLVGVGPAESLTVEVTPMDQPFLKPDGDDLLFMPNYGVAPRGKTVSRLVRFASPEDAGKGLLKLRGLPLDAYGTAAVALAVKGRGKQALGTVARGHVPRRGDRAHSQIMYHLGGGGIGGSWEKQMEVVARLGYRWIRPDNFPNWQGSDGGGPDKPFDFSKQDALMDAFRRNGLYLISNAYGSPMWAMDKANWDAYFYAHGPELDPQFEKWAEEAARRWCGADGEGPLQAIDYWNEPWEGGGISAWRGDAIRYRQLYNALYAGMKRGAPKIRIGGCSSIMNTGDKFFTSPELEAEYSNKVEILTDHYVGPAMCYGPRVAERMGILSMESETWFGGNARYAAATLAFFLATGQKIVNINHPAQLMWLNSPEVPMVKPAASALNAYLHFAGDRPFERVVFLEHLPWLFQFGAGNSCAFLMLGDGSHIIQDQFDRIRADGRIRLSARGGLRAYDVYGNELEPKRGELDLPLNRDPCWLVAEGQDAEVVVAAVRAATIERVKPVDLVLRDFTAVPAAGGAVQVEVRNVLNRPVAGTVTLQLSAPVKLEKTEQAVSLAPGERRTLEFAIAAAAPDPQNAYAAEVVFRGADGEAKLAETLQANVIAAGTPKLDGNLDDWAAAPPVRAASPKAGPDMILRLWKPWEQVAEIKDGLAEFRAMRDDRCLYLAIRERNAKWEPMPRLSTRNDDKFFGATPATAHTYWSPKFGTPDPGNQSLPYYGHLAQIAIGLGLGSAAHHLPELRNVPAAIMAMPDTDYEYAVWAAPDGGAEIWRNYAVGQRWVRHYAPRTVPKGAYDGVPKGAQAVVRKQGDDVIYEVALPYTDMPQLKPEMLAAGKTICLTFKLPGSNVKFGAGKSATRPNGMSTLPRWETSPSNEIRWGLAK